MSKADGKNFAYMRNQSPLAGRSELFASLHPALTAIESGIGAGIASNLEVEKNFDWAGRALAGVQPTAWKEKIEAARDNAVALRNLRVLYDEQAITALSAFLSWEAAKYFACKVNGDIHSAIVDAMIAIEAMTFEHEWLKPILKARILKADALRYGIGDKSMDARLGDRFITRLQGIQLEAFKALRVHLKEHRWSYPSEQVVPGRQFGYNHSVDLRSVQWVRFVACLNSSQPASERLAELLEQCDKAMRAAWESEKWLRGDQKTRLDEQQHASLLLDLLRSDGADAAMCGGKIQQQVKEQDKRRYEYETYRHVLLASVRNSRLLIEQAVETLKKSAEEAEVMLCQMEAKGRGTIGSDLMLAVIVNNCLSADAWLRRWSREMNELTNVLGNDLSRASGPVLEPSYAALRKQFQYSVDDRRDELAGKPKRTYGACDFDC